MKKKNYYSIEAKAISWLEKQLESGRIVFKKTESGVKIYHYLSSKNLLVDLHGNYFFLKKEEELAEQAFKLYFWKILVQFLDLRFLKKNKTSWYLTGKYPYEFLVDSIKIPEYGEQITLATKANSNTIIELFPGYKLIATTDKDFDTKVLIEKNIFGDTVPVLKPEYTIINSNPAQYQLYEENIVSYMKQKDFDSDYILEYFKMNSSPVLQARFIGAMEQIGNQVLKVKLKELFENYGYKISIENPFTKDYKLQQPGKPAFVTRFIFSLTKAKEFLDNFEVPDRLKTKIKAEDIDKLSADDIYHNLTIEGYDVTKELIYSIQSGSKVDDVADLRNISATKGFMKVLTLIKNLTKEDYQFTQELTEEIWKELWSPSINAGIFKYKIDIYRNHMVSIKGANYVPPAHEKIHYLLEEFYKYANNFDDGFKQGIFLHYFYVGIHPHGDGNGRVSRFLMNLAFIRDKYKWLTIPSEDKKKYFAALERSQLEDDISYFAKYIRNLYKIV